MCNVNRIAILGATSQIARDLIISFSAGDKQLHLFARRPLEVARWLKDMGVSGSYLVDDFSVFPSQEFDAVINFVGVGNPAHALTINHLMHEITLEFDELVLNYLNSHRACRYIFLSSGAAYGSIFNEPVNTNTPAKFAINNSAAHEWYGIAKLHAESRHRARPELGIVDVRVFNYFSSTQDLSSRFLITDILRAIINNTLMSTSSEYIVRDYLHPTDFFQLINCILSAPITNDVVDCYTKEPIDKPNLLLAMQERFGLRYKVDELTEILNATGNKAYYFSTNKRARDFGYNPAFTSLEGVEREMNKIMIKLRTNRAIEDDMRGKF